LSTLALLVVVLVLLCALAPAIYAATKRCWKQIGIWAAGTLAVVGCAYLVPIEPFLAVMFAVSLWLDFWLFRVAEKKQ
jgi:hypothetical protein